MKKAELDFYAPWLRKLDLDCRCEVTGRVQHRRAPAPWRPGEVTWPICSQCGLVVVEVRKAAEVVVESVQARRLERLERRAARIEEELLAEVRPRPLSRSGGGEPRSLRVVSPEPEDAR